MCLRTSDDCSGKKREAYMIEMQKLREGHSTPEQSAVQGRLTISDIKLPLKSEFMSKIGSAHGKLVSPSRCNFFVQVLSIWKILYAKIFVLCESKQ